MNKTVFEQDAGTNMSAFHVYNGPTLITIDETKNKVWVGNEKNEKYIVLTKSKITEVFLNGPRTVAVTWNKKDMEIYIVFCDRSGRMRKIPYSVFGDILKVDFCGNRIYVEFKKAILKIVI